MTKLNCEKSVKGISRAYRKALRAIGCKFPLTGPIHVRADNYGVVEPQNVAVMALCSNLNVYAEPAPAVVWRKKAPPVPKQSEPDLTVPFAMPEVFKRVERVSPTDGRKRVDYRKVANPKAGQSYYVKREVAGKAKWVELPLAKIVEQSEVSAAG